MESCCVCQTYRLESSDTILVFSMYFLEFFTCSGGVLCHIVSVLACSCNIVLIVLNEIALLLGLPKIRTIEETKWLVNNIDL